MTNIVDQSAWWNPLLTSEIFTWLGGTATYITNALTNSQNLLLVSDSLVLLLLDTSYIIYIYIFIYLFT